MVSHDLRNLLAGIALHTEVLVSVASDSDEGRQTLVSVDRIQRYVASMNRLIGDLVDVASIDVGKLAVHPKPGEVGELISESITTFEHAAREKGLSLGFTTGGQPLAAVFDRGRMLQVIANIVANAMRFTPRGGAITLAAAHAPNAVVVSVLDTGGGIAEDMREAIFERFAQAAGNGHRGLGLGLYISKCIVEAQGGRILAGDPHSGNGAAFHFTIPTCGSAIAPQAV